MKQIILLFTIFYLMFCLDQNKIDTKGPAHNIEDRGDVPSCSDKYVWQNNGWLDDNGSNEIPGGASDCVDLHLWDKTKGKYYDRCCYVRFQIDGEMHAGCVGLHQENLNDSTETIKRMQKGDRAIWTRLGEGSKIYQLDCNSSFLKYFYLASLLLCLLL